MLIVRLKAIYTINRSLEGAGKGTTEPIVKDIMKQMRSGLSDKALIIKVASVQVIYKKVVVLILTSLIFINFSFLVNYSACKQ